MTINEITGEIMDDKEAEFRNELAEVEINALITDEFIDMMEQYEIAKANYDRWVAEHDKAIMNLLKESGTKTIKTPYVTITYVSPSVRQSVDTKKLKAVYREAYEDCLRETKVKESLRIKMRED